MQMGRKELVSLIGKFYPDGTLLKHWELKGGVSAQMIGVEIRQADGRLQKLVVRSYADIDPLTGTSLAAREFQVLQRLQVAAVKVPQAYVFVPSGGVCSDPCMILEYVDGTPDFEPFDMESYLHQLATQLAGIHQVDIDTHDFSFLSSQQAMNQHRLGHPSAVMDDRMSEGRIRKALGQVWPLAQQNDAVLLHGDFWPGNVLLSEGNIVAVIDWDDCALGDPLADLATSRLEMLWAFGLNAMHQFTTCYQAQMPQVNFTQLADWDLWAALKPAGRIWGWGLGADPLTKMVQQHQLFVEQALRMRSGQDFP